jgi:hypothetical protein
VVGLLQLDALVKSDCTSKLTRISSSVMMSLFKIATKWCEFCTSGARIRIAWKIACVSIRRAGG